MFTGIVTHTGVVRRLLQLGDLRVVIDCSLGSLPEGVSVACDGVCLTVAKSDPRGFEVDVSRETFALTNASAWEVGTKINLERSLKVGDELGGHIVSGHVDGRARVLAVQAIGGSRRIELLAPDHLAGFIAPKGSVALNGASLTINEVEGTSFAVNLIPQTLKVTNLDEVTPGDELNLEIDMLARYVQRILEYRVA